ncbi:TPA: hypothetical protein ACSP1Z_000538 [Aeromonas hydrophila]|nr:hypothetical protein [Aeromonas dhakensis]
MDWGRDMPWRQGHLLDEEAIIALGIANKDDVHHFAVIVATHDCDLAQSTEAEPEIELIIGKKIEKPDGNNTYAKTARKLHIKFDCDTEYWCEFEACKKRTIQKALLAPHNPRDTVNLSIENKTIFQVWLASRYRRSAFPDEFEQRLKTAKLIDKIARVLKPLGEKISAILFDLDDGEEHQRVGEEDIYDLCIFLMYSDGAEDEANKAAENIDSLFKKAFYNKEEKLWKNIQVRECKAKSEYQFTHAHIKTLKRWRYDHISLGADPQQSIDMD